MPASLFLPEAEPLAQADPLLYEVIQKLAQAQATTASAIIRGDKPPEGSIAAPPGTLFIETNSAGAAVWIKNGNAPGKSGWTKVIHAPAATSLSKTPASLGPTMTQLAPSGKPSPMYLLDHHTLQDVADGPTFKKIVAVSNNRVNTGSINSGAVSSSAQQSVTTYVNITTSGQIASATITPNNGYMRLTCCGAIASTNATATGWGLGFYKNGVLMSPSFQYQAFDSAEAGNSKYKSFSFTILDTSPGTAPATYSVSVNTNTGGTLSLIPVVLIAENIKA